MSASPRADLPTCVRVEVPPGPGPHAVSAAATDLVVVRTPAGPRVFEGHCPHRGALLGEGELEGGALVCRNHRWRFDLTDGRRLDGPGCLVPYTAREQGSAIEVDIPAAAPTVPRRALRRVEDLPGPPGLPLVGNSLQIDISRLHQVLEGWAARYGPVFRYHLAGHMRVAITDPELCEQVLRARPERFRRMSTIETVFEEMGVGGVFSAEGAAWRPLRRLSMEALSHRHLKDFYPTLARCAEKLRARLARSAASREPVDIVDVLKRFTVDATTLLTLGHDVNTLEQGDDVIQRRLEQIFPAFNRRLFALVPLWRLVRLPVDRRLDTALRELREWMSDLVSQARERLARDPAHVPANFLEAMVAARDHEGQAFADSQILSNLLTMLVAGEDTTAYTLAWAVHHLCDAPEATDALVRELDTALRGAPVPETIEDATRLAYTGAVASETMRLRPVAPILVLETIEDTELGDLELPAGTPVTVLLRPAVLDEQHFADPQAFRPERWLPGAPAPHDPSVHMPFGSGPRLCPGRTLALLEMKLVLATIYASFRIERRGDSEDVRERFTFTMNPEGLEVAVRPR